ncbi:alpha/beta hydrolase [Tenacibaculum sp.]|uniref:alpha/beta hydrolase n=1 Tax=Tenacibaculum sp. TaxID=1906242 RepID=UPI003D12068E
MKPRLLVLSDLWGKENANWVSTYVENLSEDFEVVFYSSCELAGIPDFDITEQERHRLFVESGVEQAVKNLLSLEKEEVVILAFSIGGTIGWKASLRGLMIKDFYAVSATRLRYEEEKLSNKVTLYYGEKDAYKPDGNWFEKMKVDYHIIPKGTHELYRDKEFAIKLCLEIKSKR